MSNFTFEEKTLTTKRESLEWDNVWWEQCNDLDKDRVLIIGDSISCGYRRDVTKALDGYAYVDGFGTAKGIDNPYMLVTTDLIISQEPTSPKMILINNGLHGWHLSTPEYKEAYKKYVSALIEKYPDKKFALILTTPQRIFETKELSERNSVIIERNIAAQEIADEFKIDTIDLYSLLIDRGDLWSDIVHLTEEGYTYVAKFIAEYIKKNI